MLSPETGLATVPGWSNAAAGGTVTLAVKELVFTGEPGCWRALSCGLVNRVIAGDVTLVQLAVSPACSELMQIASRLMRKGIAVASTLEAPGWLFSPRPKMLLEGSQALLKRQRTGADNNAVCSFNMYRSH